MRAGSRTREEWPCHSVGYPGRGCRLGAPGLAGAPQRRPPRHPMGDAAGEDFGVPCGNGSPTLSLARRLCGPAWTEPCRRCYTVPNDPRGQEVGPYKVQNRSN